MAETEVRADALDRVASPAAIAAGVGGLLYSVTFLLVLDDPTRIRVLFNSLLLMLGGLFGLIVFPALYVRLRNVNPGLALLGLIFSVAGAFGTFAHGGYDLGIAAKPPGGTFVTSTFPNPADPRGLMTFAAVGIGIAAFSYLIVSGGRLPDRLGQLGLLSALLLLLIYVGRLVILDPKNPVLLVTALAEGFVVGPAFYIWTGMALRERAKT